MNVEKRACRCRTNWNAIKRLLLAVFFLLLSTAVFAADAPQGATPSSPRSKQDISYDFNAPYVPGEVLVKFRADVDMAMAADLARGYNCTVQQSIHTIRLHRLKINDQRDVWEVAAEFAADPGVEYAEPNFIDVPVGDAPYDQSQPLDTPALTPSDPRYEDQWHYPLINMPDAWNVKVGGSGVIAAVVDSGVRFDHPDLAPRLSANGYDFLDLDSDPTDPDDGHGTHVAGTVGAATNNGIGVAGMTWNGAILPVRALGDHFQMAQGFRYACGLLTAPDPVNPTPVGVLNYSGGGSHSLTKEEGVAACNAAGVIMVCAAGNDYCGSVIYPAAYSPTYDKVIAVAATDYNFGGDPQRAPYSNCGTQINVAAPGGNTGVDSDGDGNADGILSTSWNYTTGTAGYSFWQGTSMAAPHVTGLVALMLQQGVNPDSVRPILQNTATDLGAAGFDTQFGHGLINARAALDAVPKIAIIMTSYLDTTKYSVDKALDELGRVYAKFTTFNFDSIDLSPYHTIIVAMDGGNPDAADIQHLANFANGGGNLIMLGGSSTSTFANAVDTSLLDIDSANYTWAIVSGSPDLEVTAPDHQLAQDLPRTYNFVDNLATYYMIRSQDTAAEEVAVNGDGETALLKKKLGNGTLTWFVNDPNDDFWSNPSDYAVLKQIIENALGVSFASPSTQPRGLTWDGTHLWNVDSGLPKAYFKIDPSNGTVTDGFNYPGSSFPLGITFDGTNIWSTDWTGNGTIYKHNPADMSIVSSFPSPRPFPADLAWDGTYLWAAILQLGPIIKINPATGVEVGSIPAPPGSRPFGLTYAHGYLYVGDDNTDTIFKLNPVSGAVVDSWPAPGPYPVGLAFDGTYLWVSDWSSERIYRMMEIKKKSNILLLILPIISIQENK